MDDALRGRSPHASQQAFLLSSECPLWAKSGHQLILSNCKNQQLNTGGRKHSSEDITRCGLREPPKTKRGSDYSAGEST
jgi:hypothetical protein